MGFRYFIMFKFITYVSHSVLSISKSRSRKCICKISLFLFTALQLCTPDKFSKETYFYVNWPDESRSSISSSKFLASNIFEIITKFRKLRKAGNFFFFSYITSTNVNFL